MHNIQIELNDALSYNSIIELKEVFSPSLPEYARFGDAKVSVVACALKSRKVLIYVLCPQQLTFKQFMERKQRQDSPDYQDFSSGQYFLVNQIDTELKPSCLLQISKRHIAVASGFLNERSRIEVFNIFNGERISKLSQHADMIDSMRLINVSFYTHQVSSKIRKLRKSQPQGQSFLNLSQTSQQPQQASSSFLGRQTVQIGQLNSSPNESSHLDLQAHHNSTQYQRNPFIRWLVSFGRDNKMTIWKLFEGRIMHSDLALPLFKVHSNCLNQLLHQKG
mmetsp:Transcript_4420/g.7511  ORF Transcript_4420/g.7511 Transcript_4420/m.7511 type:complete len:278 (-) Transcript_4420:979-1812(-)